MRNQWQNLLKLVQHPPGVICVTLVVRQICEKDTTSDRHYGKRGLPIMNRKRMPNYEDIMSIPRNAIEQEWLEYYFNKLRIETICKYLPISKKDAKIMIKKLYNV